MSSEHQTVSQLGMECLRASALGMDEFIETVCKHLSDCFRLKAVTFLSCDDDRWTIIWATGGTEVYREQDLYGKIDKGELERTGLLQYSANDAPDWTCRGQTPEPDEQIYFVPLRSDVAGEPLIPAAVLLYSHTKLAVAPSELQFLSECLGTAFGLALKNSCNKISEEVMTRLFDSRDLNSFLDRSLKFIVDKLKAEAGSIFLQDETTGLVRLHATTGLTDRTLRREQIFYRGDSESMIVKGLSAKQTEFADTRAIEDISYVKNWEKKEIYIEATSRGIKSVLYVPITTRSQRHPSKKIGMLRLVNRRVGRGNHSLTMGFINEDRRFASHFCDILAMICHTTTKANRMLHLYEVVMHGTKSALEAINDDLGVLRDCRAILEATPRKLSYALVNAISYTDDLRWQIKRSDLVQKSQADWEMQEVRLGNMVLPQAKALSIKMGPVYEVSHVEFTYPDIKELPSVRADPNAVLAVMRNLIENSLKYCNGGRVKIGLSFEVGMQRLRIFFKDDGIGIPEEDENWIFVNGYRGDMAMRQAPVGAGVGLAWCRLLMKDLGGDLSYIKTGEGAGAMFAIELPIW